MRRTVQSLALILILSAPICAGEMQFGVTGTPPPPPPSVTQEEQTVKGEVQNGAADSLAETVLTVLESVLALALF